MEIIIYPISEKEYDWCIKPKTISFKDSKLIELSKEDWKIFQAMQKNSIRLQMNLAGLYHQQV